MAAVLALAGIVTAAGVAAASDRRPSATPYAWTLDDARGHLALNPRDAYIQYVALQLAHQEGAARLRRMADHIDELNGRQNRRRGRSDQADLFSIFTGALAVQESLQLDTMRGEGPERSPTRSVPVSQLKGPTIKSHPWLEMLDARNPDVAEIARCVPADQYLVQARSLTKLLELTESGDLWATHLFNQAAQNATTCRVGERLKTQLALRTSGLTRPFYDLVVDRVAVTGSDLYLREGSDVTLIFQVKQPAAFKSRVDQYLTEAREQPGAERSMGRYGNVEYVHVATPDRRIHVFSAWPREDLHVRSNSIVGLTRVLAAIVGETPGGENVERLGETDEFKYIRTLMPEGAAEEDVFVYLSDAFVRRLVGPRLKLTERRRMLGYNHLRMINHAAQLYRTQFGRRAQTLADLVEGGCASDVFGQGALENPNGGQYALASDGLTGTCTTIGRADRLTPCCEIPLANVSQEEADAYQAFVEQYNSYWRTFFDPIAIRIGMQPKAYRVETIVLPLIDNSIYTGLASVLGGDPQPLDGLPVPRGNIFSVALQFDQDSEPYRDFARNWGAGLSRDVRQYLGYGGYGEMPDVNKLLSEGLGNQIGLHIYDATQLFEFNMTGFLGQALGNFNGRSLFGDDALWISMLVASLNTPVYVSVPVKDAAVVDEFFEKLDPLAAIAARKVPSGWFFEVGSDFYKLPNVEQSGPVRTFALQFGPLKWRFFWARIGDGLYIATKKFILDDIAAAHVARTKAPQAGERGAPGADASGSPRGADASGSPGGADASGSPGAHAMIRVRPQNWNKVLPDFKLGWAENNRQATLNNLGRLTAVARGYLAEHPEAAMQKPEQIASNVLQDASELYGVEFLSLDGGNYRLAADGRTIEHSVYGTQIDPKQSAGPAAGSSTGRLLNDFAGATVELTFLEDGLHAVLTLERK